MDREHAKEERHERSTSRVTRGGVSEVPRWLLVAAALSVVFLAAAGWQWWRLREMTAQRDSVRTELAFAQLEATLAAAAVEAQQGSYEVSRQYASAFFTGLQEEIPRAPRQAEGTLQSILRQRDEVITQLTRGDPQTALVLSRLLGQYRQAVGGPDRVRPMGEGA